MSYLALLATLVTLYVRPGDLSPTLGEIPILKGITALLALTILFSWMARTARPTWTPHLTWLVGTWFAFTLSNAGHGYLAGTTFAFTDFFRNFFIAVAIVSVLTNWERIRGFATAWVFSAFFLAIGGIVQVMTGVGFGGQPLVKGRIQGVGIFGDPNDLALAFIIAVPLASARFARGGLLSKLFFFFLASIFTYATFLTNSRGGILSLLLVFFALSAHRFGRKLGTIVGALIVVALLLIGPSRMNEVDSKEGSAQGRIAAWSEGLQMFKQHPVVGVGYGLFTDYNELTAHNSFVLCFAETGFVGAFFWVGLLYVSILTLRRISASAREGPDDEEMIAWSRATLIAFIGFFGGIFFLSRTYNVLLYLLVGFAAAIYSVALENHESIRVDIQFGDRRRIAGLVFGGIALTYFMVKTLAVWTGNFY